MDISGNGLELTIKGSITFPAGFSVTQLADDTDPFDVPELQIGDTAMGVNSDLVYWNTPNPIEVTVAVIPNGEDDKNLSALFNANRPSKGSKSAKDVITLTGIYPDGTKKTLVNGYMISGMPLNSVASAGRLKSKAYVFRFESVN